MDAEAPSLPAKRQPRSFAEKEWGDEMRRKAWAQREANRAAKIARELDGLEATANSLDPSNMLLPKILADEIAFRSQLLQRIKSMEDILLTAIEQKQYDVEKASLPTLMREWRGLLELGLSVVEKAKALDLGSDRATQVASLLQREALLRHELTARGVLDETGRIRVSPEHQTEGEATGDTIDTDTMAEHGSPPVRSSQSRAGWLPRKQERGAPPATPPEAEGVS